MGYTTYMHNWIHYLICGFFISGIFSNNLFLNLAVGFSLALIGDYYEWKNELYKKGKNAGVWELAVMASVFILAGVIAFVIAIINGKVRI